MNHSAALFALLAVSVAACNNDPSKGKPIATVSEPVQVAASAAAAPSGPVGSTATASTARYAFSNDGSKVSFVGAKITGKHNGSFGAFTGNINLVGGDPLKSSVTVEIDSASLTSDAEKLTGHLKSPDFFDVAKFPKARFTSTSIAAGGDKGATHTVTGNLELHGVTKSVTFPASVKVSGDAIDLDAEFGINRKDFGLVYPGKPDDLIKDEVLIKLEIHSKKAI